MTEKIAGILSRDPNDVAVKLAASLLAVAVILLAAWAASSVLNRAIQRAGRKNTGDGVPAAGNLFLSLGTLIRVLFFYGGIFAAAVAVLEIFRFEVVSAADLKNAGLIALKVIAVVVAARLAANLGRLAVARVFARKELKPGFVDDRRAQTLGSLLKNGITYLTFFVAGLMVLQIFNVNTSAILASAGILGLAVGFGAQNLVKDVISGFFIIFEDQFAVGDYVEAGGVVGVVEEIGLRTCKIRKWTGQLQIIPNGEITKVTNYNRGYMMAVAMVGIDYAEDVDRAMEVLRRESEVAHREIPAILEVPVVQGVVSLGDFSVNIRTVARTVSGEQWAVERELLRRFKNALDREGIEIPYPRRLIQYREENGGGEERSAGKQRETGQGGA